MKPLTRKTRRFFEECGRKGGRKRARRLSPAARLAIASRAANARWKKGGKAPIPISSMRLEKPSLEDPVFLEELLREGSLNDWKEIYQKIADHPFGSSSNALEKVLESTLIYGATPLWKEILRNLKGP